jgi:phosphohistidine phosphatase
MTPTRTLLLLRHAQAQETAPDRTDAQRELTAAGHAQAAAVGRWLQSAGLTVDHILCSAAVRTQQTMQDLQLTGSVEITDALYNAGSDTIIELIHGLPDDVEVALVIGHAPGIPQAAHELAHPLSSDPGAVATVEHRFPPATIVRLETPGSWSTLDRAALTQAQLAG